MVLQDSHSHSPSGAPHHAARRRRRSSISLLSNTSGGSRGRIRGSQAWQIPLLTLCALGAQSVWSLEIAFASPYLLELGLAPSEMALVFVAGPLSGLFMQPIVGVLSDSSTHAWGRRRPFLLVACTACSLSVLTLAFARSWVGMLGFGATATRALAILAIFGIDFSVNAVNALDRALVLDLLPTSLQSSGHSWSARLSGVGAILGFLIGQSDLSKGFLWSVVSSPGGAPSESQLRCVSVLTVLLLCSTHVVSMWAAIEVPLREQRGGEGKGWSKLVEGVVELKQAARTLPDPVRALFTVQFFASCAWFSVLFYSSVLLISLSRAAGLDTATATRASSLTLAYHAVLSLVAATCLPYLVRRTGVSGVGSLSGGFVTLPKLWAATIALLAVGMAGCAPARSFASPNLGSFLIAIIGISWGVTQWAPFALLGVLTQKQTAAHSRASSVVLSSSRTRSRAASSGTSSNALPTPEAQRLLSSDEAEPVEATRGARGEGEDSESDEEVDVLSFAPEAVGGDEEGGWQTPTEEKDQSGTMLGLHNVAIVLPQFLVTLLSTIIFAIFEPGRSTIPVHAPVGHAGAPAAPPVPADPQPAAEQHGGQGVVVIFLVGAVAAATASVLAFRMARKYASQLAT